MQIRALIIAFLALTPGLQASWTFKATLTQSGPCPGNAAAGIDIPAFNGIPTKATCESTRSQVLTYRECVAIYQTSSPYNFIGNCCVFYTCTPCSGSDDTQAGVGSSGGTFNSSGPASGEPFFKKNANTGNVDWANETADRNDILGAGGAGRIGSAAPSLVAPSTGNQAFDDEYFKQMLALYVDPNVWKTAYPTLYQPGDERTTADEPAPAGPWAGEDEASQAQPIGGVGVHQGKPDTPPPPNPIPAKNVRLRQCSTPGHYFNDKTLNCYSTAKQCQSQGGNCFYNE